MFVCSLYVWIHTCKCRQTLYGTSFRSEEGQDKVAGSQWESSKRICPSFGKLYEIFTSRCVAPNVGPVPAIKGIKNRKLLRL